MLNKLREMMAEREEGFTLIELLVVVIIIGILAAIAIPVFLNQRNGARDASVKSDINAVAKNLESAYTDNNVYPSDTQLDIFDPRTSPGNEIYVSYVDDNGDATGVDAGNGNVAADGTVGYQICGFNVDSQKVYIYDSLNGGLAATVVADDATCDILDDGNGKEYNGTAHLEVIDSDAALA